MDNYVSLLNFIANQVPPWCCGPNPRMRAAGWDNA
jgi:hypothetical protein